MKRLLVTVALLAASFAAGAAGALQLHNEVFQEISTPAAGGGTQVQRVPAAKVVPGDEVLYVISYRNTGAKPADDVVISNPVPRELQYKAGSASTDQGAVEVSVDGGKTWGELAALGVAGADGQRRPAQSGDVTHVRWRLKSSIKPEQQGEVSFKAVLR